MCAVLRSTKCRGTSDGGVKKAEVGPPWWGFALFPVP
jgi:hypothetical protein